MRVRNGYVFIETVIVILVLASSMLILYTSYSHTLKMAKNRVYYDDASYVYRSLYISKELVPLINFEGNVIANITQDYNDYLSKYNIGNAIVLKNDYSLFSKCNSKLLSTGCDTELCNMCKQLNFNEDDYNYLRSLGSIKANNNYILLFVYNETYDGEQCADGKMKCMKYYTWVDTGVSYE